MHLRVAYLASIVVSPDDSTFLSILVRRMSEENVLRLAGTFGLADRDAQRRGQRQQESLVELYASMRSLLVSYAHQIVGSTGEPAAELLPARSASDGSHMRAVAGAPGG